MANVGNTSHPENGFRFSMRWLFAGLTLLAVLFAGTGWFYRQFVEPRQRNEAIHQHLASLAKRRPKNMQPRQWESAVAWTLNLHGNSLLRFQTNGPTMRRFDEQLTEKLAGEVNMDTIHWIWDQYAELCPGGANYQRFRALMLEEIQAGGADWGMNVP